MNFKEISDLQGGVARLKAQLCIANNRVINYQFQNPRVLRYALKNGSGLVDLSKAEKAFFEADHHGKWVGEEWVIDESIG